MLQPPDGQTAVSCSYALPRTGRPLTRAFDILFATLGLILLFPLFAAIAVAIRLDDGGPIFYQQKRVGKCFRLFRIYKFRSMVAGADSQGLLTGPNDKRQTAVGRTLRRYKLDELPQLFNVLKGDMQLVGPRPEVERYVNAFRSQYEEILLERPGLTDPATLMYRHEEHLFSKEALESEYLERLLPAKLQLSLEYQKRRGFWSDLRVLLRTLYAAIS